MWLKWAKRSRREAGRRWMRNEARDWPNQGGMAPFPSMEQMAADIAELKRAALQTAEILVDHSDRFDRLERSVDGLNDRFDGLNNRFDGLNNRFDAVTERLDRLIAATMAERTLNAERLGAIDHRLDRLEQRLDRVEQRLP